MRIEVACQSDQRFAPDLAVMLHSLLHRNQDDSFHVHFVHDDLLPADDGERLRAVAEDAGAQWSPVAITAEVAAAFPRLERYGGVTAWFRLLLPRLLGDLERVLYLDADLLVTGAVRELWDSDLEGACLGAVTQPVLRQDARRVIRDLGLPDPRRYFNSGVMLMDLARLREEGLMREVEQVTEERTVPTPWADQDPLNKVLWRTRRDLHPRWNVMNPLFDLPARLLPWPAAQVAEALDDPRIIHFIGPYKPWHHRLRHPWRERYFEHLAETPYALRAEEGRTVRHRILRQLPPRRAGQVEWTEYRVKRLLRRPVGPAVATAARRVLRRNQRLYAWARIGYRALARTHHEPLSDLLQAIADAHDPVYFIQIGSNDADHNDPLRSHVETRNWRGVLVEPVPYVFERLRKRFGEDPRITLVNAAVGPEDGRLPFYYVAQSDDPGLPAWYDQIGSFLLEKVLHPYHIENIPRLRERIVCEQVPCLTFESLWQRHRLPRLDIVHIDAEGYDDQIISQIDLERLAPLLVLYEHKHLPADGAAGVAEQLTAHGYELLEVGPDAVAVRRDAPLAVRLALRRQRRLHR